MAWSIDGITYFFYTDGTLEVTDGTDSVFGGYEWDGQAGLITMDGFAVELLLDGEGDLYMEGEDGDSDNPRAFGRAKVWKRLLILVAGSFMNLVAGLLIMTIYVASVYQAIPTRAVASVDSASVFAGQLQAGDSFYSIGGERVYTSGDVTMLLDRCEGGTADIVVLRGGEKVRLPNAQVERRDFGGEQLYGFTIDVQEKTLGGTLGFSWNSCVDFVRIVRLGLGDLFTGRAGLKDMSGPVGIVEQVTETANQQESAWEGLAVVLYYFSFIAINLGVMNLLPIPALDGGRIVGLLLTTLIERITRKKLNPKYEAWINGVGMVLLLLLIAVITFKDIFHLFT